MKTLPRITFRKVEFSDESASSVTGDALTAVTLAEVDDCSNAQYSDREVDDSLDASSDRASEPRVLIVSKIRDCISASDN